MGILDGADVLYINKVQAAQTVQLVSHIDGFVPLTSYSVTTLEQLRQQLEDARVNGYAFDNREINEETVCYAVALKQRNKTLAAISISIPVFRATKEKIADVTRILLNARSRIEQELNTLQDINIGIDSHH